MLNVAQIHSRKNVMRAALFAASLIVSQFPLPNLAHTAFKAAGRPQAAQTLLPGSLDPTFGNGGIISRFIGSSAKARAVAIQPDGKIVETGWYTTHFGIIRYNTDGSPDSSFGSSGVVSTNIIGSDFAESVAIQNDGRIVVAGWSWDGQKPVFATARYNANGSLDTSFGGGGTVTTASPLSAPSPNVFDHVGEDMAIQPDGKIVVVGESYYCAADDYFCDFGPVEDHLTAARYNVDGSLDVTFGNNGFIVEAQGYYYSPKVAVQVDGKILVAGGSSVIRYKADGSRDTAFGEGGVASAPGATDIAIQANGKIVMSVYAIAGGSRAFGVVRLNGNGTLDSSFGSGGEVVTPGGGVFGSQSNSLAIQSDSRIVVAGTGFDQNDNWPYAVRRYNPNGSLDHSYGTDGLVTIQVGGLHNEGFAVAVDADGRAVVGGCAFSDSGWGLVRLTGGFAPTSKSRADFDGDGKTDQSVFRESDGNWYALKSGGGVLVQNWGTVGDIPVPGDYDNDNKTDTAIWRPSTGQWFVLRSSDSTVSVTNWGTSGDKPVAADYDGDGKTDVAVWRPSDGNWYVIGKTSGVQVITWGEKTDLAVPADYDGDGKTDIAVWRPSTRDWYVIGSTAGLSVINWGVNDDRPVPADYNGDGKADLAVFRPSKGNWYIRRSSRLPANVVNWGVAGDIPVPGDYDGDGKTDVAMFRPSDGNWYVLASTAGLQITNWGNATDIPVPAKYIP